MKKQWGGLLTFIMIAVLSIPAAGQQQAPAADSSGQASGQAPAPAAATPAPAAAPSAPAPLPSPSMTAPLQTAAPQHTFSAGPFGTVAITGILSGMGLTQSNWIPGDKSTHWDLSNGQIFLQKTTGWWQFYLQGGAYNIPDLGAPFLKTTDTLTDLYGPLPVAYLKLVKGNFNVEIGELPTLIGAEYTFSFENMNIERGLLWNQENAISRGVQVSDTFKKLSLTVSWNDGFYSNVYNWITGSAMYQFNASNMLMFVGGGNAGQTRATNNPFATPLALANESIYNVMYTYSHESWTITPYWQYTHVPTNAKIGLPSSGSTDGGALLINYNFKGGFSLAARPEYITSSSSLADTNPNALNLIYGPGSSAFGFTVTPTYQKGGFFLRADVGVADARKFAAGDAFGNLGTNGTQVRGVIESGFMF